MTETTRGRIEEYIQTNASLEQILSDPEIIQSNSKWILQQHFES